MFAMLSSSATAQHNLSLAWNSSLNRGVAGYNLYLGGSSRIYTNVMDAGNATRITLTGLVGGAAYFFAVTAYDVNGLESAYSREIRCSVPSAASTQVSNPNASFSGLFFETNQDQAQPSSAGSFTVVVTPRNTYSGQLQLGGRRYSISGKLNGQGQAANTISQGAGHPLSLELSVDGGGQAQQISGSLSDGTWVATLSSGPNVFASQSNPAPYAGSYTLVFPGEDGTPGPPAGDGFGTVRVNASGQVFFAGELADGTKVSQSALLTEQGLWPCYLPLYGGKGFLLSWLAFTNEAGGDLSGLTSWLKPAMAGARYYPGGFTNQLQAVGSSYVRPAGPAQTVLNLSRASVTFTGGDLSAGFTDLASIGQSSRAFNLSGRLLNLTFSPANGVFTGSVADLSTGKPMPFGGVVLQELNAAYGLLMGADQSSRVVISGQ